MMNNVMRLSGLMLFAFSLAFTTMLKSQLDLWLKPQVYSLVFLNRFGHWIIFMFNAFYPFIFDRSWDGIFLGTLLITSVHWLWFKNECIVTYLEKKLLDPSYVLGQNAFHHPFVTDLSLHPKYGAQAMMDVMFCFTMVSMVIVLWRSNLNITVKITYLMVIIVVRYYVESIRKMKCV